MENPHTQDRQKKLRIRIREMQKQGAQINEVYVCMFTKKITINFDFEDKTHNVDFEEFCVDLQKTIKKIN